MVVARSFHCGPAFDFWYCGTASVGRAVKLRINLEEK